MLLICNNRPAANEILEDLEAYSDPAAQQRLLSMEGRDDPGFARRRADPRWQDAVRRLALVEEAMTAASIPPDPTDPGARS
jgi:hypothetical protein